MSSIISQETWDKMPQAEKERIIGSYFNFSDLAENGIDEEERIVNYHLKEQYEMCFGKENLNPQINPINTWEDIKKLLPDDGFCTGKFKNFTENPKIILKCQATSKIAKLIELGYGGMITDEEWRDRNIPKYVCQCYTYDPWEIECTKVYDYKHLIAFHTPEQQERFMSFDENIELIKQYFMQ